MSRVRLRLIGEEAELGRIPASDIAHLWLDLEAAIAQASGHIIGRRLKGRGRRGAIIEAAKRLRVVGLTGGSVVMELEVPEMERDRDAFEIDVSTLGEDALEEVMRTARGVHGLPDTARRLQKLADDVGIGVRYDALEIEYEGRRGPRRAIIDRTARDRLRRLAETAAVSRRGDRLVGVLFEADFESHTARLRTSARQPVQVQFAEGLADGIQEVLRRPTELVGEVTYDPETGVATRIELRELTRAEQLAMGLDAGEFWDAQTIEELQRAYGVEPIDDLAVLRDTDATEEEIDAFFQAFQD